MTDSFRFSFKKLRDSSNTLSIMPPDDLRNRLLEIRTVFLHHPVPDKQNDYLLVLEKEEATWVVLTDGMTIGAAEDNDITLKSPYVSGHHCLVQAENEEWSVKDLGAKNGVWVNGRKCSERVLRDGDIIRVGDTDLLFSRRQCQTNATL